MKLRLTLAAAFLVLAFGGGYVWYRTHTPAPAAAAGSDSSSSGEVPPEEYVYVPEPHISLRINGTHKPAVSRGTPLLFSVRVANQQAINAALLNRAHQIRWAALQEKLTQAKVRKEEVDALSDSLHRDIPIKSVELGSDNVNWADSVRFMQRMPDGKDVPLAWTLRKIGPDADKKLTLDATATAELDFGADPEEAAKLAPADYVIVAVLEVARDETFPSALWRGRVESEPVTLKVQPESRKLTAAEAVATELDYVSYFLAVHQGGAALAHAQKAVAANPNDIDAHIAVGDCKATQDDVAGALEAYEAALGQYSRQQSDSYERPTLLLSKISDLRARLQPNE